MYEQTKTKFSALKKIRFSIDKDDEKVSVQLHMEILLLLNAGKAQL